MKHQDRVLCPVIIVDDEIDMLESEKLSLELSGITGVIACGSAAEALLRVSENPLCVVVLDITMPDMNGISLLERLTQDTPGAVVIMLTGLNDAETAVRCLKSGAFDYLIKPVDQIRLATTVRKAMDHATLYNEAQLLGRAVLDDTVGDPAVFQDLVTADFRMLAIFRYIEALAGSALPMLVTGETGVGKELIAGAVHRASGRGGEFVCVNTAGIDDTLFADTLFGHDQGAFTGADKSRPGLIDKAAGGTLFLDEIGDMSPLSQVKLLRILQDGTYYRLGSERECSSDARVVAATNRPLEELAADRKFRKDLFYRLKAHHVNVPPLRERAADIPRLTDYFVKKAALECGKPVPAIPRELYLILSNYHFPGNVRELQGMIYDAVGRHGSGTLSCDAIKQAVGHGQERTASADPPNCAINFPTPLPTAHELESLLIDEAIKRAGGNKKLAAEMIGMARQTFRCKLAR
jgi:DNA-binding NtrC family response regulator